MSLDELDSVILQELQQDARRTNRELAKRLGIAPSTCMERVRRLLRRGVIRGYHAEIALEALGREVQALVAVSVRPLKRATIDTFQDELSRMPEVMSIFVLAGGDDFLVHVGVPGVDRLHAFLVDSLSARKEVVGFRTSVIFRHVRRPVLEPLTRSDGT